MYAASYIVSTVGSLTIYLRTIRIKQLATRNLKVYEDARIKCLNLNVITLYEMPHGRACAMQVEDKPSTYLQCINA